MKVDARREQIIALLMEQGTVLLDDLAARFGVSKMTIHRDLDDLEAASMLRRVRGGASVESSTQFESDYRFRERRDTAEKRRIAQAAAHLIEPGMTVFINDGSTAGLLAGFATRTRPLTVITNNMAAMEALANATGVTLLGLGGVHSRKFNGFFGIVTEESLAWLRADIAFISTPAISGLTCYHMDQDVVRSKRLMISGSTKAYLLADHRKFGRSALHRLAAINEFEAVITGEALPEPDASQFEQAGIDVIIASGDNSP